MTCNTLSNIRHNFTMLTMYHAYGSSDCGCHTIDCWMLPYIVGKLIYCIITDFLDEEKQISTLSYEVQREMNYTIFQNPNEKGKI